MKCPFCKTELVPGKQREFEDICDHAENPNAESYPMRPTLECSNPDCVAKDTFWDEMGSFYSGKKWKLFFHKYDSTSAIGSWMRKSDIRFIIQEKMNKIARIVPDKTGWRRYCIQNKLAQFFVDHNILFGHEI
jgi:hypothetical protein